MRITLSPKEKVEQKKSLSKCHFLRTFGILRCKVPVRGLSKSYKVLSSLVFSVIP